MICRLNTLLSLTFPDLDKNHKKFPDYSRFALTLCKNGLFSRFSRFSMNPVRTISTSYGLTSHCHNFFDTTSNLLKQLAQLNSEENFTIVLEKQTIN